MCMLVHGHVPWLKSCPMASNLSNPSYSISEIAVLFIFELT